jgi:uncharacterized membrane protein
MKRLTNYFFKGLAFLLPVVLTLYVIYAVFTGVDRLFQFRIPGMGVLVTLVVITVIGFIASNFLTRWTVNWVDGLMRRVPLVKMIYSSVKDLIHAFVGEKKGFNRPVAVALGGGIKAVGFMTSDSLEKLGMEGMVAVYLPQSYNFAGNLVMVPAEQVSPVQAESADVMAFVVSGGIAK